MFQELPRTVAVAGASPLFINLLTLIYVPGHRYPEQKLTREQALKGMTLDAAYASFMEKEIGSLTPGKKADFVVLDKDIMTIPVSEILTTKVAATVVDGQVVYGNL